MSEIKKVTAQELKDKFLQEASPLIDQYLDATFGVAKLTSVDAACRKEVWGLLKVFLEKADEKIFLDEKYRDGAEGVLLAIQDGVLTIEEGERLITIHAAIKGIKVAGGLQNLNQTLIPSLTINTVAPPEPKQLISGELDGTHSN